MASVFTAKIRRERVLELLPYAPILLGAILMVLPYYWMVIGAFKSLPELQAVPPEFLLRQPTLDNWSNPQWSPDEVQQNVIRGLFQRYLETEGGFIRFYFNSVVVAVINTVVGLMVASLSAFVLAKHRFPGRNIIFMIILASMMVPWQVSLIPNFITVHRLGWLDSYWGLIIPAIPRAFALFFLRQFMLSLPDDLIDAARVDGASELRIWWRIVIPLTIPAMVAMGIFMLVGEWNNLLWPLVIIQSSDLRTLPIVMSQMLGPYSPPLELGVVMVASLIVSLPTLVLFLLFQKQFVRGIALTGLKG